MASSYAGRFKYKQDMPPPGGYKSFVWERTFPKITRYGGTKLFLAWLAITPLAYIEYRCFKWRAYAKELESVDTQTALQPFLLAERDRMYLQWTRYNLEEEERVMSDVPGWKPGTYYGEPSYFTVGDNWVDFHPREFMMHSRILDINRHYTWWYHHDFISPKWYWKYLPEFINDRVV